MFGHITGTVERFGEPYLLLVLSMFDHSLLHLFANTWINRCIMFSPEQILAIAFCVSTLFIIYFESLYHICFLSCDCITLFLFVILGCLQPRVIKFYLLFQAFIGSYLFPFSRFTLWWSPRPISLVKKRSLLTFKVVDSNSRTNTLCNWCSYVNLPLSAIYC